MDPLPPLPGQAFNPQADEEADAAGNQLDADHQPNANNGAQPQIVPPPPQPFFQPPPPQQQNTIREFNSISAMLLMVLVM